MPVHLHAADHNTNNVHNDKYYGVVADKNASTTSKVYCLYADGTYDTSGWTGLTDEGEECFEPTDKYKGNIARALFYMATRYSKVLSPNSENEPYLTITKGNAGSDDNASFKGVFHNLEDFLIWNELDPVDEYERHRNNLIYKNVQDNRNPFIDHPEWVRRVFDESYDPSQSESETPTTSSSTPSEEHNSSSIPQTPFSLFGLDTQTSYIILFAAAFVALIIIILIMVGAVKLSKKTKKKVKKAVVKAVKTSSKKSSTKKK